MNGCGDGSGCWVQETYIRSCRNKIPYVMLSLLLGGKKGRQLWNFLLSTNLLPFSVEFW